MERSRAARRRRRLPPLLAADGCGDGRLAAGAGPARADGVLLGGERGQQPAAQQLPAAAVRRQQAASPFLRRHLLSPSSLQELTRGGELPGCDTWSSRAEGRQAVAERQEQRMAATASTSIESSLLLHNSMEPNIDYSSDKQLIADWRVRPGRREAHGMVTVGGSKSAHE